MRKTIQAVFAVVLLLAVTLAFAGCQAETPVIPSAEPTQTAGTVAQPEESPAEPAEPVAPAAPEEPTPAYTAELTVEGEKRTVNMYQMVSAQGYSMDVILDEYDFVVDYMYDCVDWKKNDGTLPYVSMSVSQMEDGETVDSIVDGLKLQSGTDEVTTGEATIGAGKYAAKTVSYQITGDTGDAVVNFCVFEHGGKVFLVQQDYFLEGAETVRPEMDLMLSTLQFVD